MEANYRNVVFVKYNLNLHNDFLFPGFANSFNMEKKINRLNLKNKYRKLSITQKAIILKLLRSKAKTIMLDKNSGDTIYLVENTFLHQPEQVYSLGWNNEIILIYVPQLWLMELYNEEPELFT